MNLPQRPGLGFRSRSHTYTLILGVVVGMLAAGLAIPFVFGKSLETVTTSAPSPLSGNNPAGRATASTSNGSAGAATASGAAAPGGSGSAAGGSAAGSGSVAGSDVLAGATPAVEGLTASDQGVTPTTITIAFLIVDLGGVSKVGFSVPGFDVESQKRYISTFLDNINKHGGIYGRAIQPVFITYDPTNQSTSAAACRAATQDNTIFAAIDAGGGLNEQGQLCFTQQNRTPLIGVGAFGTPHQIYEQAGGYLFTTYGSGLRDLANMVYLLDGRGVLKGKRLGIVDRDFPGVLDTVTAGLVDTLTAYGYEVAYRADLSSDDGTATSQVPVAAQQMQAHGVDTVFLLTDFIIGSAFVQSADKSTYHPLYLVSDFESMTNDTAVQSMPQTFQGIGVTASRVGEWRVGMPEPAVDAACREIYKAGTGEDPQRSENAYGGMDLACGLTDLIVRGATGAGPELTRQKYVDALQQVGSIDYPFFGGFSYQPGKFDGADHVRTLAYDSSCTCWMPQGDFTEPRY